MHDQYLYAGLIRLQVLRHAAKEPIYGLAMIEELERHGYRISASTLYPILHGLETKGYLTLIEERSGSTARRVYRATAEGVEALCAAKLKVRELFGELFEDEPVTSVIPSFGDFRINSMGCEGGCRSHNLLISLALRV